MTVEVTELTTSHEPAYERFVAGHPDALISYSLGYRDLLAGMLGCQPHYAVALRDRAIVGVMPLMSLDGAMGTVLNSMPYFGSSGGPLVDDAQACAALCAWYAERAHRDEVVAATVIGNPVAAQRADIVHDLVDLRIAHVTPLPPDGDAEVRISALIDGSARRNVAKAKRCRVQVTVENDGFSDLGSLHRSSMQAIGGQTKSPAFFAAVPQHFSAGTDFNLYIARIGDDAVAALLVFYCATTVDYYVPAASPDRRSEQPMAAILLAAMSDAARRGLKRWNWGGSWPSHESLQRFKAKWGGVPHEYRYETKLNEPGLLRARCEEILAAYPGFYVVPFSCLHEP